MFFKIATRLACATALLASPLLAGVSHSQTLTMAAALQRALATNPRLTAAERDIGIAGGQRIQSGALINPEISHEQDNSVGSGAYRGTRLAESTLQISQMFELWGKHDARIAARQAGLDQASIERQAVRLEVLGETKFEMRDVEMGARNPENVEIVLGLLEGDKYAAKNSFIVKAKLGTGSAGHEH